DQILAGWLAELEPPRSSAIHELLEYPLARSILLGIAEFSPYLFDLIRADAARLIRLLLCEPDQHLASLIAATTADVLAVAEESEAMRQLRRMKSEAALLIALCDIGGVWPVMRVTEAMSELATAAVQSALRYLLRQDTVRR